MRYFSLLLLVCGVVTVSTATAQTTTTEGTAGTQTRFDTPVSGLGLQASLCTGMGISFREHLAQVPLAFQLTAGAWKAGTTLFDVGAEVQYDLAVGANRLYAVGGFGYYYDDKGKGSNGLDSPTRFGVGVGYELPFSKQFGISLDLIVTVFEPGTVILPLPSIGGYIYFK